MREALRDFLIQCRAEGKSPRTVEYYQDRLAPFVRFCEERGVERLEDALKPLAWEYLSRFPNVATRNATIRAIARFGKWALEEGVASKAPIAALKQVKQDRRIRQTLTPKELQRFLAACPNVTKLRDQALATFLYDTGCRISEAITLTMPDLSLDQGFAKVMGKGGKERLAPFGSQTALSLTRYLRVRRPKYPMIEEVFLSKWGTPLDARHLAQHFQRTARRAGLKRANPHLFRHSAATELLRNGAPMPAVKEILGHEDLRTTQAYLHLMTDDLIAAHRLASPADRLRKGAN